MSSYARRGRAVSAAVWDVLLSAASQMPERGAYALARAVGRTEYGVRRRAIPMRPEHRALAATPRQLEQWRRRSCELKAYEELDLRRAARSRPPSCAGAVTLQGVEHLDAALAAGKGAILYSVHVRGNYTMFGLLGELGYPINIVRLDPPRDPGAAWRHWRQVARRGELLEGLGCRFLGMAQEQFGVAVKAANALRRNEVVVTQVDVLHSRQTVDVRLFGGHTRLISGHAVLAQLTGAPLLSYYVHRASDWRSHVAEIGPPLHVLNGRLDAAVQESATLLEPSIVRSPAQWYI